MTQSSKIALLKEMLESAESSLRSAKQVLGELMNDSGKGNLTNLASRVGAKTKDEDSHQVIEGVFDGQGMIGPDKKTYSVPANYASKSKLIPGDVLKLTITDDGSFVYKQIGPVDRKRVVGTLTYDEGQYRVIATGKSYKVLLASVTYFHGEVGDRVTLVIPELEDGDWGAIENIIPPDEEGNGSELDDLNL